MLGFSAVAAGQWPKFIWSVPHLDWLPRPDRLGYAGLVGELLLPGAAGGACDAFRTMPTPSLPLLVLPLIKCGLISLCFTDASTLHQIPVILDQHCIRFLSSWISIASDSCHLGSALHQIILSSRLSFIKLVIAFQYQSASY